MLHLLVTFTVIVMVAYFIHCYNYYKDVLHPIMFITPLFFYVFAFWPIALDAEGILYIYVSEEQVEYASFVYLVTIIAFYIGLAHKPSMTLRNTKLNGNGPLRVALTNSQIKRTFWVGVWIGLISVGAFCYMLYEVGGFYDAYNQAKGGGRASSGYIREAVLLSFPSLLLLSISLQKTKKFHFHHVLLILLISSPHLIQGALGGRRGPLFLILITLFFCWYISQCRLPSLKALTTAVSIAGISMILAWSQRQHLFIGSDEGFEADRIWETIVPSSHDKIAENSYIYAAAAIAEANLDGNFYWGYRYFVTLFIRPIPKQLWPSKYEDMGADWLRGYGSEIGGSLYLEQVGYLVPGGAALPSIADGYLEFSWGVVVLFYALGRLFSYFWARHRIDGEIWTVCYFIFLGLSVYIATQSISAWAFRVLFMLGPTLFFWCFYIQDSKTRQRIWRTSP